MLVSWALEDSLERSDAMRARGWSANARRTSYRRRGLSNQDLLVLFVLSLLVVACAILGLVAAGQWHFYPTMPRLIAWWGYVPYALLCLLPAAATLAERGAWEAAARKPASTTPASGPAERSAA